MGKTPKRNSRQLNQRNTPHGSNHLQPNMPYVLLQRFERDLSHQGEGSFSTFRKNYNRSHANFNNPFPPPQAPRQQNHAQVHGPCSQYGGMRGNTDFYGRYAPHQTRPQPSPQHGRFNYPGKEGVWQQHQSPMIDHSFASQRPPFNHQQWKPPTRNVRGRRQQTPMKRGASNMALSVATSPAISKTAYTNPNTIKVKSAAATTAWKRSPINLRQSLEEVPLETRLKIMSAAASGEDIPLLERLKSLENKRKSIEASVKRLSMPRNPKKPILSVSEQAKTQPSEEKLERRRSSVTKKKSLETSSINKLTVHKNSKRDITAQQKIKEKRTSLVTKRKSMEAIRTRRSSMPKNAILSVATQVKSLNGAKNDVTTKTSLNKRKTLDSATIKNLSLPLQNSRRLSNTLKNRTSLITAVDPQKKKITSVEASSKVLKGQEKSASKLAEKSKVVQEIISKRNTRASVAAECISPMYYTPNSSPANLPTTRSKSCPRSPTISVETSKEKRQSTGKTFQPASSDKKQTDNLMARLNARRSTSRSRISETSKKSDGRMNVVSAKNNKESKSLASTNVQTRSQSRAKSMEKVQVSDMKRKRSVSVAPSSSPTPKKTKITPTSNKNVTPNAVKKSGSIYTPSRRQILMTSQSTVGTPRSRKSQPTTPQQSNRAAQMVQTVLNQQQERQHSVPSLLPTDVWRVGHSIAVQTVDPTEVLSDYDRLNQYDDSSSDEDDTTNTKDKFKKQLDGFKQSLKGNCVLM